VACKGIDAQVVRPEDSELTQLLGRFVPVRITNFKGVDMNRFRFDYDLTFAVLMLDAEGAVYARYGSRDATSATNRLSIAGLKQAMKDVLAARAGGTLKPVPPPAASAPFTLANIPAYAASRQAKAECAHCHFANNFRLTQLRQEGKFTKELLFQYPLPDNIGIRLEVDRNNQVQAVLPGSPAARAGVKVGDTLVKANDTPVLTGADLQFALNAVPDAGMVTLAVARGGKPQPPITLQLPRGWRRTDISWRASQDGIPPQVGVWGEPLPADQRRQRGLAADKIALRVTFMFPGPEWAKARNGLQMHDVITGVNGEPLPDMTARQFHAYFRLKFNVGDTATLNVLRGEQKMDIPVPCMEVKQP
jgi:membrane-associated protease RseP (regulator of RpoE activity)